MPQEQEREILAQHMYFRKLKDAVRVRIGKTYYNMILPTILQVQLT